MNIEFMMKIISNWKMEKFRIFVFRVRTGLTNGKIIEKELIWNIDEQIILHDLKLQNKKLREFQSFEFLFLIKVCYQQETNSGLARSTGSGDQKF